MQINKELKSRILTLLWNTLYMAVAYGIDSLAENLLGVGIPKEIAVMIGLLLAQISKFVRNLIKK